jgi:hypothetical protein
MNKRSTLVILVSLFLLSTMIVAYAATPAKAQGAYDGTYDFKAQIIYGPGDIEYHDFGNCFVISDSQVSNTLVQHQGSNGPVTDLPADALSGSVTSSGVITFTGPNTESAAGYTYSDWNGQISGTSGTGQYVNKGPGVTSPNTLQWTITLVSGSGSGSSAGSSPLDFFGQNQAFIFAVIVVVGGIGASIAHQSSAKAKIAKQHPEWSKADVRRYYLQMRDKKKGPRKAPAKPNYQTAPRPYTATKPDSPAHYQSGPEETGSPITADGAQLVTGELGYHGLALPDSLGLRSQWTKKSLGRRSVDLDWQKPSFDKNTYELTQYEIRDMNGNLIGVVEDPNVTSWNGIVQGKINSIDVKAVFKSQQGLQYVVETSYAPP